MEHAFTGLKLLVTASWYDVYGYEGWTDAVLLVCYTLKYPRFSLSQSVSLSLFSLGTGGTIALASHNTFTHNFERDVVIVSIYGLD